MDQKKLIQNGAKPYFVNPASTALSSFCTSTFAAFPRRLKALGNHAVFEPEWVRGAQPNGCRNTLEKRVLEKQGLALLGERMARCVFNCTKPFPIVGDAPEPFQSRYVQTIRSHGGWLGWISGHVLEDWHRFWRGFLQRDASMKSLWYFRFLQESGPRNSRWWSCWKSGSEKYGGFLVANLLRVSPGKIGLKFVTKTSRHSSLQEKKFVTCSKFHSARFTLSRPSKYERFPRSSSHTLARTLPHPASPVPRPASPAPRPVLARPRPASPGPRPALAHPHFKQSSCQTGIREIY